MAYDTAPPKSDLEYLAMAALDYYPVEDGLPKSTSVVYRIHQLGHKLQAMEAQLATLHQLIADHADCNAYDCGDCIGAIQRALAESRDGAREK